MNQTKTKLMASELKVLRAVLALEQRMVTAPWPHDVMVESGVRVGITMRICELMARGLLVAAAPGVRLTDAGRAALTEHAPKKHMVQVQVLVQKLNSGINMAQVARRPQLLKRRDGGLTPAGKAFCRVEDQYKLEVREAFEKAGILGSGYAKDFERAYFATAREGLSQFMQVEPWGFAFVDEQGNATMGDTGSTPTSGRAAVLACYQAPLDKVQHPGEQHCTFEKIYTVEVEA
jgi:hypothetical protein